MPKDSGSGARDAEDIPIKLPPAQTLARRAEQLAILAEDLVEERLRKGTASPTEVTAVLRYGSPTEMANLRRIEAQTAYLEAQRAKAESETVHADMMDRAIEAMTRYNPPDPV